VANRDIPRLRERLRDEHGKIRQFVNVYVNDEDIRFIKNLKTLWKEGDQLYIIPAIAVAPFPRSRLTLAHDHYEEMELREC